MKILTQKTVLLSILLLTISVDAITNAEYQEADYMSDLMKALTTTPSGWSNNTHYCKWNGIVCESNRVVSINLPSSSLTGTLPPNLYPLSHNNIGPLPRSLGNSAVRYLSVNNQGIQNGFTDTIEVISSMRFLSQAWLNSNYFPGSIPNMFTSKNLFDLQLQSNYLSGLVPPSLLALTSLNNISLDNNHLQGPTPVFTWSAGNQSDACIRWFLIKCQRGKIVSVDLENYSFSGPISPAFSNLRRVHMSFGGNKLTAGMIPDNLTTLPHLQVVDISHNNLSGKIPKFSSKVKLFTQGNPLLGLIISGDGRGKNATHSGDDVQTRKNGGENDWLKYVCITGMLLYPSLYVPIVNLINSCVSFY